MVSLASKLEVPLAGPRGWWTSITEVWNHSSPWGAPTSWPLSWLGSLTSISSLCLSFLIAGWWEIYPFVFANKALMLLLFSHLGYPHITDWGFEVRRGQEACLKSYNQYMVQKVSPSEILGSLVSTLETIYMGYYFISFRRYRGITEETHHLKLDRCGFNPSSVIYSCVKHFKFLLCCEPHLCHCL